jgi:alpha-ketoglutarate-dependent taurine dioxygenase
MAAPAPLSIPHATYPLAAHPDALPLVVEARGDRTATALAGWCKANAAFVADTLARHGAILFRDFDVPDAPAFEQIARAIDDDLKCDYLGTSPRDALTGYVFTASELPSYYPIPQHCEMSFIAQPPRRLFFCCLVEPARGCGETPLADFRKVAAELPASVLARFEARGLRIVRNYSGPSGGRRFDLWRLKRWDQMFGTTDKHEIEARCRREGFEPVWTDGDGLRIVSWQPAIRTHPVTGERVWHNHSTTFHPTQAAAEYRRIFRLRSTMRHFALWKLAQALEAMQRRKDPDELAMYCTYGDGTTIAPADLELVRDAVWRHLVTFAWQRGDVLAIDNYAVSHGRLPYRGPRQIAVCWA